MATKLGKITLPDNPTPEQLKRAEPLLVKMILEDSERAYSDGIQPLTRVESDPKTGEFVRTAPGEYEGIFVDIDGSPSFKFKIVDGESVYSPIGDEFTDE